MFENSGINLMSPEKKRGNLQGNPSALAAGIGKTSGFMRGFSESNQGLAALGNNEEFLQLVSQAMAQSEMNGANSRSVMNKETARGLLQIKAMAMETEMLSALTAMDKGDQSPAEDLVGKTNLEAFISANNFGNLLGNSNLAQTAVGPGRTFSPAEFSSFKQKTQGLRANLIVSSDRQSDIRDANLRMPYGLIRPPARNPKAAAATDASAPQVLADKAPVEKAAEQPRAQLKTESEIISAQKTDAQSSGRQDEFNRKDLEKLVDKVALALNIDPNLVMAVIKTESNFNHKAVSPVGAKGLMQLMPGTAKELGVDDPFNPVENVWAGARYLKKMLDRHGGNINKALASYNWGPGNFDRKGKNGHMPNETRRYIKIVNQHMASYKKSNLFQA